MGLADLQSDVVLEGKYLRDGRIGMDNYDNAMMVWTQWNNSTYDIIAREYRLEHWDDVKTVDQAPPPQNNVAARANIEMNECRKMHTWIVWDQTDDLHAKQYFRLYR